VGAARGGGYHRPLVRGISAVILCLLALLASGCGQRAEPTGATVDPYPLTVTDSEGKETSLANAPQRVRAVGDSMAATLRALGLTSDQIVEVQGLGSGADADLTVAWATSRGPGPRQDAGPTYIGADQSIEDVRNSLLDIGLLVGQPIRARALAEQLDRTVADVRTRLEGEAPVRVFLDTGTFDTIESPGLVDDIIRTAGGRNVAGAATENQRPDPRELRRLKPRYYLATSGSGTTLARLRQVREMKRLGAVRDERFGIVPDAVLAPGPRVGEGVLTVARIIHPDAFR
jgi:iron complex transport system substrate-binding protein